MRVVAPAFQAMMLHEAGATMVALIVTTGGATPIVTEGWWTVAGTIIAGLVLVIIGSEAVKSLWRQWRLRKPCKAWFLIASLNQRNVSYAVQDDNEHYVEELRQ